MEPDEFDLAGFCIGIVERDALLDGTAARAGDAIVGLAVFRAPRERLLAGPGAGRADDLDLARAVPGAPAADARRRGDRRGCSRPSPSDALATLGEVLLTPTRIYARDRAGDPRGARDGGPRPPEHGPRHRRRPAGQRAAGAAGAARRAAGPVDAGRCRRSMRLLGALGGLDDAELRATFNGGLGMVVVVPARTRCRRRRRLAARASPAWSSARSCRSSAIGGAALRGGAARTAVSGRIAVGVSRGRARTCGRSHAAADRGELGGDVVLVVRRSRLPGARLGGGAGDRDRPRAGRRRRGAGRHARPGRGRTSSSSPATCGSSARGAGGVRGPDPQRPSVAAAGVPGRARHPRRARRRRRGHRRDRPPRRRDARRRADRGPGGRPGAARRRRGGACRRGSTPSSTGCCRGRRAGRSPGPSRVDPVAGHVALDRDRPTRTRPGAAPSAAVGLGQDRPRRPRPRASSPAASSSSPPAARRGPCARPACR